MTIRQCPCGLVKGPCPYGYTGDGPASQCPRWRRAVAPKWWERIIGTIVAIFGGRW